MKLVIHSSIHAIPQEQWESWFSTAYPFTRWAFLAALEDTQCTTAASGWEPAHLQLLDEQGRTLAAAPAYLKSHSYGEYVFDWSWADAWQRYGLSYYPKLVTAIPFTPATGPRLYLAQDDAAGREAFIDAVSQWCQSEGISGWHVLFAEEAVSQALVTEGMHQRLTTQFHWYNRGFATFDDFLATFSSRKRKNLRKERAQIGAQNLRLETLVGPAITREDWAFFYLCYQTTYAKRSGHGGYLTGAFFTDACPNLSDMTMMVKAYAGDQPVAAALYFRGDDTLYGRYWGCLREYDFLHFEACYYRGIEYCISQGLARFDPGAQGEHKIQRGFEPTLTYSNHWIGAESLNDAVGRFTREESAHVRDYCLQAASLLPFKTASTEEP